MNSSQKLWSVIAIISLLCTALFVTGFIYAVDHVVRPKPSNLQKEDLPPKTENPLEDGEFKLLAIGDSLTKGTGDVSGEGYAGKVKQLLEQQLQDQVFYINYAVNGYRTDQLLDDLLHRNGTILQTQEADLIVMTIGANDLFQWSESMEVDPESAKEKMPQALAHLEQIFARIHELNPFAQVIYTGLYNPFIDMEAVAEEASLFVHEWNYEVQKRVTTYSTVLFVPTFDLFFDQVSDLLAADHYHPNETGHRIIADRIGQALGVGRKQQ